MPGWRDVAGMKVLVIDTLSPEHARLRGLLEGAGPLRACEAECADDVLALVADQRPGALLLLQAGSSQAARTAMRRRICARVRGSLQQVPVGEIRYFLAEHKYVWVRTAGTRVLIQQSLQSLAEEFCGRFVRIHRNALVATGYLTGLSRQADGSFRVRLAGIEERLPVSRRRLAAIRRLIVSDMENTVHSNSDIIASTIDREA